MKEEQIPPPWWVLRFLVVADRKRRRYRSGSVLDPDSLGIFARNCNADDVPDERGL